MVIGKETGLGIEDDHPTSDSPMSTNRLHRLNLDPLPSTNSQGWVIDTFHILFAQKQAAQFLTTNYPQLNGWKEPLSPTSASTGEIANTTSACMTPKANSENTA